MRLSLRDRTAETVCGTLPSFPHVLTHSPGTYTRNGAQYRKWVERGDADTADTEALVLAFIDIDRHDA